MPRRSDAGRPQPSVPDDLDEFLAGLLPRRPEWVPIVPPAEGEDPLRWVLRDLLARLEAEAGPEQDPGS